MFPMYDLCHPSYYKISQLGCTDGIKINIAFYVYMELCEVKRLWNVEYKYNKEIDIIYLEGKKSKSSTLETYIPWPTIYKISLVQIENIQENLKLDRFTVIFRGGDSTTVYYRITSGLVKPISPDETKIIKQKEEKKYELEQEIRRNTSILYELAKSLGTNENEITKTENVNITNDDEKSDAVTSEKIQEIHQEKVECTIDQEIQDTSNKKSQDSQVTIADVEMITETQDIEMLHTI